MTYKNLQFIEERVCLPVNINTLPAELEIIINNGWYSIHGEKNLVNNYNQKIGVTIASGNCGVLPCSLLAEQQLRDPLARANRSTMS